MATEIEHKYLLANDNWRKSISDSIVMRQGYLTSDSSSSIRVRISNHGAKLNIKSATIGNMRQEYEYDIPLQDANEIINTLCRKPLIEKTRHFIKQGHHTWEIDEFTGDNDGLIVAEIELLELNEKFAIPEWIGKEVTEDFRYYNNNLSLNPYKLWTE